MVSRAFFLLASGRFLHGHPASQMENHSGTVAGLGQHLQPNAGV
jgi:hypothetical protein